LPFFLFAVLVAFQVNAPKALQVACIRLCFMPPLVFPELGPEHCAILFKKEHWNRDWKRVTLNIRGASGLNMDRNLAAGFSASNGSSPHTRRSGVAPNGAGTACRRWCRVKNQDQGKLRLRRHGMVIASMLETIPHARRQRLPPAPPPLAAPKGGRSKFFVNNAGFGLFR